MSIFTSTDQFREYVTHVHRHTPWAELRIATEDAARAYLLPHIGKALYSAVEAHVATPGSDQDVIELLPMLRRAVAWYTYYLMLTSNAVSVSPMGVSESRSTDGLVSPADGWHRNDARKLAATHADQATDDLLLHMEEAIADDATRYEAWKTSSAYTQAFETLIWTSDQLARHLYQPRVGRRILHMLRPAMISVQEQEFAPMMTTYYASLLTAIRAQAGGGLTNAQADLLAVVRPWLAYRTLERALPVMRVEIYEGGIRFPTYDGPSAFFSKRDAGESPSSALARQYSELATGYWRAVVSFLDAHAADYPGYTASSWVSGSSTVSDPFIFSGDNSIAL